MTQNYKSLGRFANSVYPRDLLHPDSFMLAVPAAKLYTREMNLFERRKTNSRLLEKIKAWRFLDTWTGKLEWKQEKHISVQIYTDSSLFKWGGVIHFPEKTLEISYY